jgi:hypothetical protein
MVTLGVHPAPNPAGVPVMMTVPAGRVVLCDRKLISLPMLKMRSLDLEIRDGRPHSEVEETYSVPQSCFTWPFFKPRIRSADGLGIRDFETIVGSEELLRNALVVLCHILTDGTRAIESLGETPLRLCKLARSTRDIIASCVTQHVAECLPFRHVLTGLTNDNRQFGLVVTSIRLLC